MVLQEIMSYIPQSNPSYLVTSQTGGYPSGIGNPMIPGQLGMEPPKKMSMTTYFIIFLVLVIIGFIIYVIVVNTRNGGDGSMDGSGGASGGLGKSGGIFGVVKGGLGVGTKTKAPLTPMPVDHANDVELPPDPNAVPSVLPATIKPVTISIDANQLAVLSGPSTPPPPPPTNATYTGDTWKSGQVINLGDTISTQDKSYSATVTSTGDLQIRNATGGVVWSAYTNDGEHMGAAGIGGNVWSPTGVTFQSTDGNFIVNGSIAGRMSREGWASGTASNGTAPYRMVISPNGHLYSYDANNVLYWQSKS